MGTQVGRRVSVVKRKVSGKGSKPRVLNKLSDLKVRNAKAPGYLGDGGGLYLQVSAGGTKSWIFRFTLNGRSREMGLGPLQDVSLAEARAKAQEARKLLLDGADPLEVRRAQDRTANADAARKVTFRAEAEAYIEMRRPEWKNAKHADQWTNTLTTYAFPKLGKLLVSEIDVEHVIAVLRPIWTDKTETASRVRARIEKVLDYATALRHRSGDNPARWRGHLEEALAKPSKIAKPVHHAALPYADMGEFMPKLRAEIGTAARAVEIIILTAVRTSEALNARWEEFDLKARTWTIPAARMKSGRPHSIPLSNQAVKVLLQMQEIFGAEGFVFPGAKEGKPLSNMAGLQLLKRMGHGDLTVHGFRSAFRDWAGEQTNFPREVAEAALAHVVKDKAEAAYARGSMFEKRAKLMQAWADYCGASKVDAGNVTPLLRKGRA